MNAQIRAADAERVLNDPVIQDALKAIKEEIYSQWSATPARDAEGREWIWRHLKVAEKFEAVLRGYIATGKVEQFNEKQTFADKVSQLVRR